MNQLLALRAAILALPENPPGPDYFRRLSALVPHCH
jgi:hypothetical protein